MVCYPETLVAPPLTRQANDALFDTPQLEKRVYLGLKVYVQGNKPMVGKIIERALKSLSDNQVIINRDVWLKVRSASELLCLRYTLPTKTLSHNTGNGRAAPRRLTASQFMHSCQLQEQACQN